MKVFKCSVWYISSIFMLVFQMPYNCKITIERVDNTGYIAKHLLSLSLGCAMSCPISSQVFVTSLLIRQFLSSSEPQPWQLSLAPAIHKAFEFQNTNDSLFWHLNTPCRKYLNFIYELVWCETISSLRTGTISYNSSEVQTYAWWLPTDLTLNNNFQK